MDTNLSRSLEPSQARTMHPVTAKARKRFFCHLTCLRRKDERWASDREKRRGKRTGDETTHLVVLFPALGQQTVLHNPDGREKLQRSREKNGERVEELDRFERKARISDGKNELRQRKGDGTNLNDLNKLPILRKVRDDDGLDLRSVGGV